MSDCRYSRLTPFIFVRIKHSGNLVSPQNKKGPSPLMHRSGLFYLTKSYTLSSAIISLNFRYRFRD